MTAPTFTQCPIASSATCTIGAMPAMQAYQLIIKAPIGTTAFVGEQVTLTLTIQGTGVSPSEAAIAFLVGQATLAPVPTTQGTPLSPITFPTIGGSTVAPSNLSGLFPVITPSAGQSSSSSARATNSKVIDVREVASTLPLDPRLIGGQLAGLAVLAAALTMVMARLSLRTPATATAGRTRRVLALTVPVQTAVPATSGMEQVAVTQEATATQQASTTQQATATQQASTTALTSGVTVISGTDQDENTASEALAQALVKLAASAETAAAIDAIAGSWAPGVAETDGTTDTDGGNLG